MEDFDLVVTGIFVSFEWAFVIPILRRYQRFPTHHPEAHKLRFSVNVSPSLFGSLV